MSAFGLPDSKPAPDGSISVSKLRTFADTIRDAKTNWPRPRPTWTTAATSTRWVNAIEYDYDIVPQIYHVRHVQGDRAG